MNSQIKADTPEASPNFASGMFCSSTRAVINLSNSGVHVVGVDEKGQPTSCSTSLILLIDHENSNDKSLRWSFKVSSSSI